MEDTYRLNDSTEYLVIALNKLLSMKETFSIGTCRSGLKVGVWWRECDEKPEILEYTAYHNDSLVKTIEEVISKIEQKRSS